MHMGALNARGVGILFRDGFDCKVSKKIVDPLGRYLALEAKINDENISCQCIRSKQR